MYFGRKLMDGEYMTRICAVANNERIVLSADSLFTNSETKEKTTDNIKIAYNNQMIVGLLGAIEIFTSLGNVSIRSYIQDYLNNTEDCGLNLMNHLISYIKDFYQIYQVHLPTYYIFLYREGSKFYMWYCTIYYSNETFGENRVVLEYPLNPINSENKEKYVFENYMMVAGDGLPTNPIIERIDDDLLMKRANIVVKQAIMDDNIPTVGGQIYTVELDKDGYTKTYIDGKATRW